MAQAVLTAELAEARLAGRVHVTSAGTGDWHIGETMDRRALEELTRRGYSGSAHRARQLSPDELDQYDLILAMDQANLRALRRMAADRPELADRIRLLREFDPDAPQGAGVPDPWGEGPDAFAAAFDMIRAAAKGLTARLAALLASA
jgi:low molecular weight protein-tyrosine phosphatase